jgi:uncharacterized protein (TIGR02271 family)
MTQTIVGVFDSLQDAEAARRRLIQEDIAGSQIHIHARDAAIEGTGTDNTTDALATGRDPSPSMGPSIATSPSPAHEGLMQRIEHFFSNLFGNDEHPKEVGHYHEAVRRGAALLAVDVPDGTSIDNVKAALRDTGAVDIDQRVSQWQSTGYTGYDRTAQPYTADEVVAERKAFPVVKEELEVGKRQVDTGDVRVYTRATETPVSGSVNLREEHASIERRPVDRPATAADLKEGFVEIRETAEQPVVAKPARVVEEVVVGKEGTNRTETVNDTVRGTEVKVERAPDGDPAATSPLVDNKKPL